MKSGFNVKRARAYYAHLGLVERKDQPPVKHGRNEPVLLFAPKVGGSHKKNSRLPLPTAEPKNAAVSTWGNGKLIKIFAVNRSVMLSSEEA